MSFDTTSLHILPLPSQPTIQYETRRNLTGEAHAFLRFNLGFTENPVAVKDNKIDMDYRIMKVGQSYPIEYQGKKYAVERTSPVTVTVYELEG